MIEKIVDGVTFYCFDDFDKEARKQFEKAMTNENILNEMMMALIDAISEMNCRKRDAWEQARGLIPEEYREQEGIELEYSWILRGFRVNKKYDDPR